MQDGFGPGKPEMGARRHTLPLPTYMTAALCHTEQFAGCHAEELTNVYFVTALLKISLMVKWCSPDSIVNTCTADRANELRKGRTEQHRTLDPTYTNTTGSVPALSDCNVVAWQQASKQAPSVVFVKQASGERTLKARQRGRSENGNERPVLR
ncbi:MAG: hypothetical protein NVS4B8_00910 [Herpetosiphon sp.]